jgi:serine/threonine-protein kinase
VPLDSEEARAFLQHRLAFLGKWLFLIGALAILMLIAVIGEIQWFVSLYGVTNLALLAELGGVWLLCAIPQRIPTPWLRMIDAAVVVGMSLAGVIMVALAGLGSQDLPPWPVPALLLNLTLYFRAALIPSTPRRTAAVGTTGAGIVVIGSYLYFQHGLGITEPRLIRVMVGDMVIWCSVAVAGSMLVSGVIFRLRERVRQAAELGQYMLVEKIGEGGMGEVYRAEHALLRRPTAIKLLRRERTNERDLARFEREVQLTSQLTHPNTIAIYDFGRTPDNAFYYAMEYIDGISLEELVEIDGPQPPARVIHLLVQACGALAEAHDVGLIHRDIKPANLLLCARGGVHDVIKVVDFGLVKDMLSDRRSGLSVDGTLMGTPHYLSPEAISDPAHVEPRTDIYALGAVGYWLLTGTVVFDGRTLYEVCNHHVGTSPTPPSVRIGGALPEDLERVVLRALEKEIGSRPGSAEDFRAALLACRDAGGWSESQAAAWWTVYRKRSGAAAGWPVAKEVRRGSTLRLPVNIRSRQANTSSVVTSAS